MMPGEEVVVLKKGPWTAAEDAVLVEYVRKHGEGNWNAVQRNSGLSRCGKSCRLRWANHLRPNLKKGSFSPEEERLILELHAKIGNKWARMATQLPGRTDNEIKNYWNTRIKRRQRAGLPLYPPDIQRQAILHSRQNHHQSHPLMTIINQTEVHKSQLFSNNINIPTPLPLFDPLPINFSSPSNISPMEGHSLKRPRDESLCRIAPTAISVLRYNSHSNVINFQQQHCPSFSMKVLELPSNQFSSAPTGDPWGRNNNNNNNNNNGLLDALLEETVNCRKPASDLPIDTFLPKFAVQHDENNDEKNSCNANNDDVGKDPKPKPEPMEGLEPQTEDLSAFFDFMPPAAQTNATTGITWGKNDSGEISNGQSSGVTEDDIGLEMQQLASSLSMVADEHTWSLGSAHWDNMPSIC